MNNKYRDAYWLDAYKGLIFKIISVGLTVYNVRLMLSYLGDDIYGSWVTISSIATWVNAGDLGIGNGFRNEISKYYAQKDETAILNALYSTNKSFLGISCITFIIVLLIGKTLCAFELIADSYFLPLAIMAIFFSASLYIGRVNSIALGIQKGWYTSFANTIGIFNSIFSYKLLELCHIKPNLFMSVYIYGFSTIVPLLVVCIMLKSIDFRMVEGTKHVYDKTISAKIYKSGLKFYVLQLTSIILFSTDSVLVDSIFGAAEVTKYSLINQVYTIGTSLFGILSGSFWAGVAIHYEEKDIKWIIKTIKRLLLLLIIFSIGVLIVSIVFNNIIELWIGEKMIYSYTIIFVFGVYCVFDCLQSIFGNFNYAIDKTKVIMELGICSAVINIPLSIFFAKELNMGIMGIKLGTFASLLPSWTFIIIYTCVFLKKISSY